MPCYGLLCHVMQLCAISFHAMLFNASPCHALICYAISMLCYAWAVLCCESCLKRYLPFSVSFSLHVSVCQSSCPSASFTKLLLIEFTQASPVAIEKPAGLRLTAPSQTPKVSPTLLASQTSVASQTPMASQTPDVSRTPSQGRYARSGQRPGYSLGRAIKAKVRLGLWPSESNGPKGINVESLKSFEAAWY